MASSDNVTNEKPIDFEDGEYDPDLEVRLYAEIYYSNETYLPDYESSIPNDKATLNVVQNAETTVSSNKSLVSNESVTDGGPAPANTENQLPTNNFVEDLTPGNDIDDHQNSDIAPLYYPKSDWVLSEVSESTRDCEAFVQRPVSVRSAARKQRQLAQKGLWLTPENTERDGSTIGRPNVTPIHKETPTVDSRADDPTDVDRLSTNQENALTRNNGRKRKQKNLKGNVSKQACSKETSSQRNAADDTGVTVETDKYEVVSKKKKMKKKKKTVVPLVISSDSEDSIVEVPVPPKPPPLIIQLPDSEDECDPSVDDGSKKTNKSPVKKNNGSVSCGDLPTDSSTPDASSESPVAESNPSAAHAISSEAAHTVTDTADVSVEPACPEGDTLILNCTQIQRGASSLDEIRQMSGTGPLINTHSDNSTTENEATNSVNIAAGESDATRNRDVCSVDLSNKTIDITAGQVVETRGQEMCSVDLSNDIGNIELLNQTRHKSSTSAGIPTENPCTSGAASTVDRTVTNKEKTSTVSTINKEKTSSVSTINKEKTSSVSTANKGKTSNVSTVNKEKTSSVSTVNKGKTSSVSTVNKEKTSSVSTVNKEKTSSVSTVNKGKTTSVSTATKGKTSSGSTINKEVAGAPKRPKKAASRPFTDFDVPAIPPKRSKRIKDKAMSEYFFKPMSNELQAFYNNPWGGENMNVNDIQSRMPDNPRCWGILDADLQGSTSKRRRTCARCNTDSHIGRRCPEKAKTICCYMCGAQGHVESRCPHTMCLTCGRKYATYRPTCDYCCKLSCNICNGSGHSSDNCPDLWRRYHNTTTETIPVVPGGDPSNIMKAPQFLWCCNCGRRGHDVTNCLQLRWSQHFPTPMSVSSYTEGPFYESSNRDQMPYASSNREQMPYESSNRDQMQYESSSRDEMQYGSSNGEQMQYESSNRDQMQYESSNRDQMQYGSSNGEQMQYESSNREQMQYESSGGEQMHHASSSGVQMQNALPNEVWIHDVPHDKRIGYPNSDANPIYVPQHQERIQDTTPSIDIEVLQVYDGPEASITEPVTSVPSINVIFQCGNAVLPGTPFLRSASTRLDKVPNIHLDGLLNGCLKPMFLLTWNESFEFSLSITREPNNIVRMAIEADSAIMLQDLEKLMMQWLMRPDDEKPNLEYDIFPYGDTNEMIGNVKQKTLLLRTVLEPTILWKKIVACEESLKHIRAKHSRCPNQKKAQKRYEKNENGIIFNIMKRRSQLVTSLYSGSWVTGAGTAVRFFKDIAHELIATQNLSVHRYLDLIYWNNELFTFRTSEALSKALDKAILASQRSESITAPIAKQASVDTSGGKPPESSTEPMAKVDVCEKKKSTVDLPTQPMINNNSLSADCSPLTQHRKQQVTIIEAATAESPQIPKIFGTTDTNDGAGIDSRTVRNPMFRAASVKGAPSFQRKIIKAGDLKNTRGIQLRNLTKRNRKLYKNSARQVIKLANTTNIPHLQEMAKALKVKSGNGSITTDDVDSLRAAIGPELSQRITQN